MRPVTAAEIENEVRLIQQFADSYRRRISVVIERLNGDLGQVPDGRSVRLCIEAVDMLLVNQCQLARMVGQLSDTTCRAAA